MATIRIQAAPALPKAFLKGYTSMAVLVDENTLRHCYEKVKQQLPPHRLIVVPAGEKQKNLNTCTLVWEQFTNAGLDRHALVVVIGGGVLGDLGGFCASTYKRGIDFVLVPTTLLSMADASIGGKTGIDFGSLKNHIGTFALPKATWIATDFLKSLPEAELRSGFAEVIKHALIADRKLWNTLRSRSLQQQDFRKLVRHSVTLKSRITAKDPHEMGLRKILNVGHTLGHALESYALGSPKPLLHGEAIAAGMVMEAQVAFSRKLMSSKERDEIAGYILSVFGRVDVPAMEKLMPALQQDKKNKGNKILMALPKGIGKAVYDIPVSERDIREAVAYYRSFQT